MRASCKVCELINEDYQIKEVEWCETCKQYICAECKPNILKRGIAMVILKLQKK